MSLSDHVVAAQLAFAVQVGVPVAAVAVVVVVGGKDFEVAGGVETAAAAGQGQLRSPEDIDKLYPVLEDS